MPGEDLRPFRTTDEAWAALEAQRGMSDGEAVDVWEHQIQSAALLLKEGADDEMVVAALLHDLGDGRVADVEHAEYGANLVRPLLGERVAWLVGTHAESKRYVCTTRPAYYETLSPVSKRTLAHQGGLMTPAEVAAFASHPWIDDAVRMRLADDAGKDPEFKAAAIDLAPFRAVLERVAAAQVGGARA